MKLCSLSPAVFLLLSQIVSSQNWLTTGNGGLSKSNFIETTDNRLLIFKNKERGRFLNNVYGVLEQCSISILNCD